MCVASAIRMQDAQGNQSYQRSGAHAAVAPAAQSFVYRRRWALLTLFFVIFAMAVLYGRGAARELTAGGLDDPGSESARADALLDQTFGAGAPDIVVVYQHPQWKVTDPAFFATLGPTLERLRLTPGVSAVSTPYGARSDALVSKDGKAVAVTVKLAGAGKALAAGFDATVPELEAPGLQMRVGGAVAASREAQAAAEADLVRAELITLPLLALLLVVFFRGVVVAALPLLVGGFSVACALACLRLLTHVSDVSVFALNIVSFVGLGVAIDYSLFMTSRFREELAAGVAVDQAVRNTLRTSGRTVAYSGLAVAVSLLGLTVFPLLLLRSVAVAGSVVVVMSVVGATVFLPAMLAALGPRIEWLSLGTKHKRASRPRFWHGVATLVMRAPIAVTLGLTLLLLVLGSPFLRIRPSVAGAGALPEHAQARQVAELLESDRFASQATSAVRIYAVAGTEVLSPDGLRALESYVARVRAVPHVSQVDAAVGSNGRSGSVLNAALRSEAGPALRAQLSRVVDGTKTALRVVLDVPPTSDAALNAIEEIRELDFHQGTTLVTSAGARLIDLQQSLLAGLPYALGIICLSTFVVLFMAFGSIVMPVKAILMNVLSLTASFGALVWIFQDGRFEQLLDYRSPGSIELTIPVVMFAVVFGLAMDYELFLLSRIREAYDRSGDTHTSVSEGLEQTGQIITCAALLLLVVMIGFMSADMLLVKELGVGMAVAIIVDATLVRALLVPATMQLLGRYNWWSPAPIEKLWRRFALGVDESSTPASDKPPPLTGALPR